MGGAVQVGVIGTWELDNALTRYRWGAVRMGGRMGDG